MIVVVDTNAFQGDPAMLRRNFRLLLSEHGRANLRLAIPEVVLGELPKRYREHLVNASKKAQAGLAQLRDLGIDTPLLSVPHLDAATETYRMLLGVRLRELKVLTPPLPDTSISELYRQAIDERRPFQSRGRGFKDALIWRIVCELVTEDQVILITNNHTDFAESPQRCDVLHQHLKEDLAKLGHSPNRVRVVKDLQAFIEDYVPSSAIHLDKARILLAEDSAWNTRLFETVNQELWNLQITRQVSIVAARNAQVENVTISECIAETAEITDAYEIDAQKVSLEVLIEARMLFDFTAPTTSAEWLAEEKADIEIDLWEDSFVQGHTGDRMVAIRYAIEFDTSTLELGTPEQLSVEDAPGSEP